MPDLHDLLAQEAQFHATSFVPPFTDLVRRSRRGRRRRTGLLVLTAAAVVGLGFATVHGSAPRAVTLTTTTPTPVVATPIATCHPTQLDLTLVWRSTPDGGLSGTLTAFNTSGHSCLLLVRPVVQPDGVAGSPLPTTYVSFKDARVGPAQLLAGTIATAQIDWPNWCGDPAGRTAHVSWPGAEPFPPAQIVTQGPQQPACLPGSSSTQISSSWFEGLSAEPSNVSGYLRMVGGPPDVEPQRVGGTVTLTDPDGRRYVAQADINGHFSLSVPPGVFFTATGTSPSFNNGEGSCTAPERVYAPEGTLYLVYVDCHRK
jgi:hypothetical protein